MTEESQTVIQLPTKSAAVSTDKVLIVHDAANTNGGNVALISIGKLFSGYTGSQGSGSIGYTGSQGVIGYTGSTGGSDTSGTFTSSDGKTITVTNGIITNIETP